MLLARKVSLLPCYFLLFLFLFYFLWLTSTLSLQFLAAFNQTYIATHGLVEKRTVNDTKFLKAIDELKKSKELRKKLVEEAKAASRAKVSLEEELTKIKVENVELQN